VEQSIAEQIYKTKAEDLPGLVARAIKEATCLLEDYADKILKNGNILNNRWFFNQSLTFTFPIIYYYNLS